MPRYNIGDVVLVQWAWKEDGEIKVIPRPAVVLQVEADQEWLVIKLTSTNRSDNYRGKWILMDSDNGKKMGLREDSFIHYKEQRQYHLRFIIRKIGYCPIIEDIQNELDELENT